MVCRPMRWMGLLGRVSIWFEIVGARSCHWISGEGHVSSVEFRSGGIDACGGIVVEEPSGYALTGARRPPVFGKTEFCARLKELNAFTDDRGSVTFYATCTAYDGYRVLPQLIESKDFTSFRIAALSGLCAQNEGAALFPRKIDGRYAALSCHDGENTLSCAPTACGPGRQPTGSSPQQLHGSWPGSATVDHQSRQMPAGW